MEKYNVAILGASGVVGSRIRSILEERNFPVKNIKFLSSAKSAGKEVEFMGKTYKFEEAKPESFDGVDIVLASAGASTSKHFVDEIVKEALFWSIIQAHSEWTKTFLLLSQA